MGRHSTGTRILWIALAGLVTAGGAAWATPAAVLIEEGLYTEQTVGDPGVGAAPTS